MSDWKVRVVDYDEKPLSEQPKKEEETKDNLEDANIEDTNVDVVAEAEKIEEPTTSELSDDSVLSHIRNRFNKEINSLDELFQEREAPEELPEDVATFFKYKKETGRGLEDFMNLNRDFEKANPDSVLSEYYKANNPDYDDEDISFLLNKFKYDEDLDETSHIQEKNLLKKQELAKAKEYFNTQKEQYKAPLETREAYIPKDEIEGYEAYKQYKSAVSENEAEQTSKLQFFKEKTDQLYSDKFEGFGFKLDENKSINYKPGDANALKEQSSLGNFMSKFLDEKGYLKDAELFHRAIAIANDPDKFAKFFYDQGKSDMIVDHGKESKNIDMTRNSTSVTPSSNGIKARIVD
jgi:hypothetical protein